MRSLHETLTHHYTAVLPGLAGPSCVTRFVYFGNDRGYALSGYEKV